MAYYDALIAAWNGATQPPAGVTGAALTAQMTTQQKIDTVNAWTVAGSNQDVPVGDVEGYLRLRGLFSGIEAWQKANPIIVGSVPSAAQVAATELVGIIGSSHVSVFRTSDPTTYATLQGLLGALAANPPGLLLAKHASELLALAVTSVAWWQGNGYAGPINANDAAAAGLS